jgi:hypothetical protein
MRVMRRAFLIALLAAAATTTVFAPPPPKKPSQGGKPKADYSDWNCKWFVNCQEESFVVDVKVSSPKTTGGHTFDAHFLPGGGKCEIGADGPQFRTTFLTGVMSNGSVSGTIYLCTTSQELVDKNHLGAIFTRHFDASYEEGWVPGGGSIVNAAYKNEHYKRYDADTKDSAPSEPSATPGAYDRDEPGDQQSGFEMHRFRPGVDKVTFHDTNPQTTPPSSGASKIKAKADETIHDGVRGWMNRFRIWCGGEDIS